MNALLTALGNGAKVTMQTMSVSSSKISRYKHTGRKTFKTAFLFKEYRLLFSRFRSPFPWIYPSVKSETVSAVERLANRSRAVTANRTPWFFRRRPVPDASPQKEGKNNFNKKCQVNRPEQHEEHPQVEKHSFGQPKFPAGTKESSRPTVINTV